MIVGMKLMPLMNNGSLFILRVAVYPVSSVEVRGNVGHFRFAGQSYYMAKFVVAYLRLLYT